MDLTTLTIEQLLSMRADSIKAVAKYDNAQQAKKIQQNALYGALTNRFFRLGDQRLGEATTQSGQLLLKWIEAGVNKYINECVGTEGVDYVVACDTDSIYVTFEKFVEKFHPGKTDAEISKALDTFWKENLQAKINELYEQIAQVLNVHTNKVVMKREVIATGGFWTRKKRYALNVLDKEGTTYPGGKMKIMGLEVARSTTPPFFKDKLREFYHIVLTKTKSDVERFIEKTRLETYEQNYVDICFSRGVSELFKWQGDNELIYKKKTPIHVRGSLLFNKRVKELDLQKTIQPIQQGDKIKYCYLTMPNPIREDVIAFPDFIPEEFGLIEFIDYDTQFEKGFLGPAEAVTKACRWIVGEPTLESLFAEQGM